MKFFNMNILRIVKDYSFVSCFLKTQKKYISLCVPKLRERSKLLLSKKPQKKTSKINNAKEFLSHFSGSNIFQRDKDHIPLKIIERKVKSPKALYIFEENVACQIVSLIKNDICDNGAPIFEANPGLCVLSEELIKSGFTSIRLFETDPCFKVLSNRLEEKFPNIVTVFAANLIQIWKLSFQDLMDNGGRLKGIMVDIKEKAWEEEPIMNIIGVIANSDFIRHMVYSIVFQSGIVSYGRPLFFLIMSAKSYVQVRDGILPNHLKRRTFTILLSQFFDWNLLGSFDRKFFAPWQVKEKEKGLFVSRYNVNEDQMYLVKLSPKVNLYSDIPKHLLKPFWFFVNQGLNMSKYKVIGMMEHWVPGCGPKLIATGIRVFSDFSDLSSSEILKLFIYFSQWPEFTTCPFFPAMESTLLKIESSAGIDMDSMLSTDQEHEHETTLTDQGDQFEKESTITSDEGKQF